jgi:hypothetical protein
MEAFLMVEIENILRLRHSAYVSHNVQKHFTKFGSCIPENRFNVSLKRESFFIVEIEIILKLARS